MTGDEFSTVLAFEGGLNRGDKVVVRWTNSGRVFGGHATVSKVNEKSIVTELDHPVGWDHYGGYPAGHKIKVDRLFAGAARWSVNNRVEPIGGY